MSEKRLVTGTGKGERQLAMRMLIEKAGVQGYLTTDDLIEVFPDTSGDIERLSILLTALRRRGIEIIDSDDHSTSDTISEPFDQPQGKSASAIELHQRVDESISRDDTVGMYLKEMSRVPLLTAEEELDIAIRIEKGRKAGEEKIKLTGRQNAAKRRKLETVIHDGQLAREHIIKANTRLVVSIAKRYMGQGVAFLDLIQEGNLGLMKAVNKYD